MITAFLPCRKGSQRIPNKNIKLFAGNEGGLLDIKLRQLVDCELIDQILVSSNDERVLENAAKFVGDKIKVDERPDNLGSSDTTTDSLIEYVPSIIPAGNILWTHVTSPFINADDYTNIINAYFEASEKGYDSLMTVLKIQGFIWSSSKPVNYDRRALKWPMTQNIVPLFEVDSGAFISSRDNYVKFKDRIGTNPFLYQQEKIKSVDIDWPDDFELAEKLWALQEKG